VEIHKKGKFGSMNLPNPILSPLGASRLIQVIMNFIPLLGVIFMDWSVFALLYVFWLETLGISFFNSLKIFFAEGSEERGPHLQKALSYLLFRGFILGFYLIFIVVFIGLMMAGKQGEGYEWVMYLLFIEPSFKITVLSFFVIKLVEFVYFYFIKNEKGMTSPEKYRGFFDARLVVIHVVLVGGFFIYEYTRELFGDKTGLVLFAAIFVLVKSFAEYIVSKGEEK
jgi:hypothetical protein